MGWESVGVVRFELGPLLQGQMRIAKLKVLITRLLLVLEVWDGKATMGWEYFCVVRLLYPRRKAGKLWIHHRRLRPQRFLVSDIQSTFISRFLSHLAGGLIWWRTRHPIFLVGFMSKLGLW